VNHARHYSIEEANAALAWVGGLLERMRSARLQLNDREARAALAAAAAVNGGGAPAKVVSKAFLELRETLAQLRSADVVVRDLDRGLVDFPTIRDGREVYLCWAQGEDAVGWWHGPDSGYAGRQPL